MNTTTMVEREGKWALVPCAEAGRWQVVNTETGKRSTPLAEESARRVWRAVLASDTPEARW